MVRVAALALAAALLPDCATILKGTKDDVAVNSIPAGATCAVDRQGERIGDVLSTPGTVRVSKSRQDLVVTCGKAGHQTTQTVANPRFNGATLFNIFFGLFGVPGLLIDAGSGANMTYPPEVLMALAENPAPPPAAAAPASPEPAAPPASRRRQRGGGA